ncbi:MAG: hypothetical protein ABSF90_03555 [Syntrophobacteraceae bacterium]|jgi:hypothetical protein
MRLDDPEEIGDRAGAALFRECISKLSDHEICALWTYLGDSVFMTTRSDYTASTNPIAEDAVRGREWAVEAMDVRAKVSNYRRPDCRNPMVGWNRE